MNHSKAELVEENGCLVRVVHLNRVVKARDEAIPAHDLDRLAQTYKAMGDPTRLKIIIALEGGEMCVCDLSAYLGLSDSAVSHQLRRLKDMGLVKHRRDGQILYYSLNDNHMDAILKVGLGHVQE